MNTSPLNDKLSRFPSLPFGCYPTPVEEMPRLRQALGRNAPCLLIKRDDYTGPGFGGNKVRKLAYFLAKALADGANTIVTMGGVKSNHCRVTAALCARLGLRCVLVLNEAAIAYDALEPASLHLDQLYGAEIHRVSNRQERIETAAAIAEALRNKGARVCEIPLGASTPLGALGYVAAVRELRKQIQAGVPCPDYIFHASSSAGTQAGIVAGCQWFGMDNIEVIGVSPDDPAASIAAHCAEIIRGIGELLELPANALDGDVTVLDDYIGGGYGVATPAGEMATALVAQMEGVILDPVYTAKAMSGLLDWIEKGRLTEKHTVLFWHTGGQMALYYRPVTA